MNKIRGAAKLLLTMMTATTLLCGGAAAQNNINKDLRLRENKIRDALRNRAQIERADRYRICFVTSNGLARCLTSDAYFDFNRDVLTPDQAKRVNDLFAEFAAAHGIDGVGDILAECGGRWRGIEMGSGALQSSASMSRSGSGGAKLGADEMAALAGSCAGRATGIGAGLAGGRLGTDNKHRRMVDSAVAEMDQAFDQCRDSGNPLVAELTEFEKAYVKAKGVPLEKIGNTGLPNPLGRHWDPSSTDTNEIIYKLAFSKALIELGKWAEEQNRKREAEELAKLHAEAEAKAAAEAEKKQEHKEQETEGRASEEEEKEAQQCLQNEKCNEPAADDAAQPGYPAPDGTGSTCAEKQAKWQRFKERCDRSNWREFQCEQFLRLVNNCVDVRMIYPGPDGDATCRAAPTEEEKRQYAAERECQKRGLISMPDSGGGLVCRASLEGVRMPGFDICNDPVARPGQDQCPGGVGRPSGGQAPGGPRPDRQK